MDVVSKDKESYNWKRTLRMGFFGTVIAGPLLAVWYRTLGLTSEALQARHAPKHCSLRLVADATLLVACRWATRPS
jgi:hypothetical protein